MPSSGVQKCALDRKSTRLNSSHTIISYAVFCLKKTEPPRGGERPRPRPRPRHRVTTARRALGAGGAGVGARGGGGGGSGLGGAIIVFFSGTAPPGVPPFSPTAPLRA